MCFSVGFDSFPSKFPLPQIGAEAAEAIECFLRLFSFKITSSKEIGALSFRIERGLMAFEGMIGRSAVSLFKIGSFVFKADISFIEISTAFVCALNLALQQSDWMKGVLSFTFPTEWDRREDRQHEDDEESIDEIETFEGLRDCFFRSFL